MITPYYYQDDSVTIYHGDCLEIIPTLDYDVVVMDPPYGIEVVENRRAGLEFEAIAGDRSDETAVAAMRLLEGAPMIVFGANNFTRGLPDTPGGWIVWDKRLTEKADRMFGSPFELAWISDPTKFEMIRCLHGGVVNADGHGVRRVHPTQKPAKLMRQCIPLLGDTGVVLDPFMGSATTLRAAMDLGRRSIGVDIDERYCEKAALRLGQRVLEFG